MTTQHRSFFFTAILLALGMFAANANIVSAQQKKPNILVIWGDDIGTWNISHNNRGMMGFKTPNIDRIAREAFRSPTTMASSLAPPAAPHSSAAMFPFARE